MDRKWKWILAILVLVVLAAWIAWLWLPRAVDLLPGEIRGRLPDVFVELVTTPLPTALPAPLQPADATALDTAVLVIGESTPAPTRKPAATPTPANTTDDGSNLATSSAVTLEPSITSQPSPTPEPTTTPTPTPISLPATVLLEGLEVTPQKYNNCGPANLSVVLNYYGHEVNQLEIGQALKPNYEDRNVSPTELVRYVNEETELQAMALFGLEIDSLKALLAAGFPVIVEKGLDLSATHGWMGHYLTLYGYDEREGQFHGLDTFLGPWDSTGRPFDYASLDELWAQFNRAMIVVFPADLTEALVEALGEATLNQEVMWLAAVKQAQEALNEDAGDAFAWFDLGASLYHLAVLEGDEALYRQSAAAFDRAREIGLPWRTLWYQFEPYLAYLGAGRFDEVLALTEAVMTTSGGRNIEETYLYRGHALLATGNRDGAEWAYERALRLNPGMVAAAQALEALPEPAGGSG